MPDVMPTGLGPSVHLLHKRVCNSNICSHNQQHRGFSQTEKSHVHTFITTQSSDEQKQWGSLSVAAVWRSVEFGEGEELHAAEGKLPAAHVLLHVLHPAAVPAHMQHRTNTRAHRSAVRHELPAALFTPVSTSRSVQLRLLTTNMQN